MKLKNNPVAVLGDIHGKLSVIGHYIERLKLSHYTIIQVGDFGYGFNSIQLALLDELLKINHIQLIVVRGNHDNYNNHFPKSGKSEFDNFLSNIIFLKDFDVLEWNDKKILCIGGATSIDRADRVDGISHWAQESINYDKIKFDTEPDTFQRYMFDQYTKNIDVVISHIAPKILHPYLKLHSLDDRFKSDLNLESDLEKESSFLDRMLLTIKPRKYICGHFHQSVDVKISGVKIRVLNIDELYGIFG
jgi:predicted phosphodiesterase